MSTTTALLLVAAGLLGLLAVHAGDRLFKVLTCYRFVYLAAVFVASLLYFFWWRDGYPWKEE